MIKSNGTAGALAVSQAREGRLVIMERDQQPETIALAPEQLKIGHLSYGSTAESLGLRLEVVDRPGAVAKESVSLNTFRAAAVPAGQSGQSAIPAKEQVNQPRSIQASEQCKVEKRIPSKLRNSGSQSSRTVRANSKPPSSPANRFRTRESVGPRSQRDYADTAPNVPSVNVIPSAIRLLDPVGPIPAPQVKRPLRRGLGRDSAPSGQSSQAEICRRAS